jgi:hypothetical protein
MIEKICGYRAEPGIIADFLQANKNQLFMQEQINQPRTDSKRKKYIMKTQNKTHKISLEIKLLLSHLIKNASKSNHGGNCSF